MIPADFPERNTFFKASEGFTEHQIRTIPAYHGEIVGGSVDGVNQVVVAYELSPEDLATLIQTRTLYLTMLGGLAPHFPSLSFHAATHPA